MGGPELKFQNFVSDKLLRLIVKNPQKVKSALVFITKNAKLLTKTPRGEGELAVLDTYETDDYNYDTMTYDAYNSGLVVLDPDPSSDSTYHVDIKYQNTYNKLGGVPLWITLVWEVVEDSSATLPAIITQPPPISGVSTAHLNDFTNAASDVDTLQLPLPDDYSLPVKEILWCQNLQEHGLYLTHNTASTTGIELRSTKDVPAGTVIKGTTQIRDGSQITMVSSIGNVSADAAISSSSGTYCMFNYTITLPSDVAAGEIIASISDFNSHGFTVMNNEFFTTTPV